MSDAVHIEPSRRVLTREVILDGVTGESAPIDLRGYQLRAFLVGEVWGAGNLRVRAGESLDGPFFPVFTDAGEYKVPIDDASVVGAIAAGFPLQPYNFVKLVATSPPGSPRTLVIFLNAATS